MKRSTFLDILDTVLHSRLVVEFPIGWMAKDGKDWWFATMDLQGTLLELPCTSKETRVLNVLPEQLA